MRCRTVCLGCSCLYRAGTGDMPGCLWTQRMPLRRKHRKWVTLGPSEERNRVMWIKGGEKSFILIMPSFELYRFFFYHRYMLPFLMCFWSLFVFLNTYVWISLGLPQLCRYLWVLNNIEWGLRLCIKRLNSLFSTSCPSWQWTLI